MTVYPSIGEREREIGNEGGIETLEPWLCSSSTGLEGSLGELRITRLGND